MKVWLDKNYNITATDGSNSFTKGNNNFDTLYVCLPTESIVKDNTLPTFNFELANGRKYGPFTHSSNAEFEENFTVFGLQLTDRLLSVEGKIFITISINYFNASNSIYKSRNINIQGNVVDAVVLDNDVLIMGNEEEILNSLQQKVDALNERLTNAETVSIQDISADVDDSIGTPSVEVEIGGTPRERTFTLHFSGLKGETGPQGERGVQGVQGERGYPFRIMKRYSSVAEMQEGYATDGLMVGDLVIIVSTVEDIDNAKLYTKGKEQYDFLVDMSGATGIIGPQGPQGVQGPQGPAGENGVITPIDGFITLAVDENGNLCAYSNDNGPNFEYDPESGNIYYVMEVF